MAKVPEGYVRCTEAMLNAARVWISCRGFPGGLSLPPEEVGFIAALDDKAALALIAESDLSREFVDFVDGACSREGTVIQLSAVMEALHAIVPRWSDEKISRVMRASTPLLRGGSA